MSSELDTLEAFVLSEQALSRVSGGRRRGVRAFVDDRNFGIRDLTINGNGNDVSNTVVIGDGNVVAGRNVIFGGVT